MEYRIESDILICLVERFEIFQVYGVIVVVKIYIYIEDKRCIFRAFDIDR